MHNKLYLSFPLYGSQIFILIPVYSCGATPLWEMR